MLQHTFGIFLNHKSTWTALRERNGSYMQVFVAIVPLLALIPAVCAYIGVTQIGWIVGDGAPVKLTSESALTLCALTYVSFVAVIFVLGEYINWMSKTYKVEGEPEQIHFRSMSLAVFISAPILIAGFACLYPQPWFVTVIMGLAGAYSIYLLYEGMPILMAMPKEKAFFYASSVVTVGVVLMVAILMATVVIWGMGVGPIYID